ncbi:MAG: hypothetical protein IKX70_07145 [Treponema sp.]|nr:hypothetical protein [Treponema sp.]
MKKIILTVVVVFMAGMFVGCASTSSTSGKASSETNVSYEKDSAWEKKFWNQEYWKLQRSKDCYLEWPGKSNEEVCKIMKNKFYEIINSPEISNDEWFIMNNYYNLGGISDKFQPKQWITDFSKNKKQGNTFTGKVINDTDEVLHIRFTSRTKSNPVRCFHLEIPAHEEGYFTIPDITEERELCLEVPKYWIIWYIDQGTFDRCPEYYRYVVTNYSLELTYNDNEVWTRDPNYKYGATYDSTKWRFVPKYENENLLEEVPFNSLDKYFRKTAK